MHFLDQTSKAHPKTYNIFGTMIHQKELKSCISLMTAFNILCMGKYFLAQ
jgi:hypothetical protein